MAKFGLCQTTVQQSTDLNAVVNLSMGTSMSKHSSDVPDCTTATAYENSSSDEIRDTLNSGFILQGKDSIIFGSWSDPVLLANQSVGNFKFMGNDYHNEYCIKLWKGILDDVSHHILDTRQAEYSDEDILKMFDLESVPLMMPFTVCYTDVQHVLDMVICSQIAWELFVQIVWTWATRV